MVRQTYTEIKFEGILQSRMVFMMDGLNFCHMGPTVGHHILETADPDSNKYPKRNSVTVYVRNVGFMRRPSVTSPMYNWHARFII